MSPKPLTKFSPGSRVRITGFCGGCNLRGRMCALGILPGTEVEIKNNCPLQVKVKESSLVLGRGAGEKILGVAV